MKSSPSNNLKQAVEAILDDYTALNEGEFKGTTQKWWSFAVEPAATQILNLILDTILAKPEMQDSLAPGDSKAAAEKTASTWYWECKGKDELRAQIRDMLEGMRNG